MEAIAVFTPEQLKEFTAAVVRETIAEHTAGQSSPNKTAIEAGQFVYGLRGISELFNVSHPTAQRYKNTFLAPAISQRGRKIVVNVAMAKQLFNDRNKAQ